MSGMAIGCAVAGLLVISLTPKYEARMIVAPSAQGSVERSLTVLNDTPSSSRTTSMSSDLPREFIKFQQTFRENSAARVLAKYQGVLENVKKDSVFRFTSGPDIKSSVEFSDYIKTHVTMDNLGATTSQIITYRHPDPAFAEKFLRHLHKISDEIIRNDARMQTDARIAYMQKALVEAYNPDHRKALTDELMREERRRMAISMEEPFAADVMESAVSSAKPVWPKLSVILPLLALLGGFLGFVIYSLRQPKA